MQLLTRREYNLILRSLDYYDVMMNTKERELREDLEEKLYYNLYNPKDGIAQTNVELPDLNIDVSKLYDIKTKKDSSFHDNLPDHITPFNINRPDID